MEITNNKNAKQRRKPSVDLSAMVYGKIPPQARELEEAVLGAILFIKGAYDEVRNVLTHESFYVDAHQLIFKAAQEMNLKGTPVDMLTMVQHLKTKEELDQVGGPYYISKLTNGVVSAANIETHARIIQQKFIQRELIRISSEIIGDAYEDSTDVFDLLQAAESKVSQISLSVFRKSYSSAETVVNKLLTKVAHLRDKNEDLTGVNTGISRLNSVTGGWQDRDLIILAARPSIGKSAVAANLAWAAANDHEHSKARGVGIFSLEMSDQQWIKRILSAESEIDGWKINRGKIDDKEMEVLYQVAQKKIAPAKIFIDDTPGINIYEFKSKARKMVLQDKVGLIIVDYLQLMSGTGERGQNREQEISTISRNLKALAKELQIPVIALSQLSRDVEKRAGAKKPILSDLRESGAIEQDADLIIFLIPIDEEAVKNDASLQDAILMKIAKNRDGSLDDIPVKFAKEIQKIMSTSEYEQYKQRAALKSKGFIPMAEAEFLFEPTK